VPPEYVPPAILAGYPGPSGVYDLATGKCTDLPGYDGGPLAGIQDPTGDVRLGLYYCNRNGDDRVWGVIPAG